MFAELSEICKLLLILQHFNFFFKKAENMNELDHDTTIPFIRGQKTNKSNQIVTLNRIKQKK